MSASSGVARGIDAARLGQPSSQFRAMRCSSGEAPDRSRGEGDEQVPADLLCLEDFSDSELLRGLWARYERRQIYTWLGDVLVSVNPYSDVGAFGEEMAARYSSSRPPQAPHLYAVVQQALSATGRRQALLITGESGAGKTEATRAVLAFLAKRHPVTADVRDRLLRSTPVLEAFGNAHTRQNSNSSRFGKFIEVHLADGGEVAGATLQPYMLEASRVVGERPHGERTYHVFYLLRATLQVLADVAPKVNGPLWDRLAVDKAWKDLASAASTLMDTSVRLQDGPPNDVCLEWFEALLQGLLATGMKLPEVAECCRVVAAVAVLSDPELGEESLTAAATLLRVEEPALRSFLSRTEMSLGAKERVFRERTRSEAATLRASLAQELYATLFLWLTRFVAQGIAPPQAESGRLLGLLDLYGFEVFPSNGFEQFLINYCNERLQQFFNRQVFTREAEEYASEGLDCNGQWKQLTSACQLPALALLEGPGSLGIFGVVNDRSKCNFEEAQPGVGSGGSLAETLTAACGNHPAFRRASGRDGSHLFGVKHFAGEVFYEAAQFVRKNASAHRPDICTFLREHGGSFVRQMITTDESKHLGERRGRKLFGRTLINIFQQELNELCNTLEARDCRHIRCLRPNDEQKPLVFDDQSMLRQCRYSGLLEATRIRRQGYAHRRSLSHFASRYAMLLADPEARRRARHTMDASACAGISEVAAAASGGVSCDDVRIGLTKVFMREPALAWFESRRSFRASIVIIAALRSHRARRAYQRRRCSVKKLQAFARGCAGRRLASRLAAERARHQAERQAAERAAAAKVAARARAAVKEDAALQLQCNWRARQARKALAAAREDRRRHIEALAVAAANAATTPLEEPKKATTFVSAPRAGSVRRLVGEIRLGQPQYGQRHTRPLEQHEIRAACRRDAASQKENVAVSNVQPQNLLLKEKAGPPPTAGDTTRAHFAQQPRIAGLASQPLPLTPSRCRPVPQGRRDCREARASSATNLRATLLSPRSGARSPRSSGIPQAIVATPVAAISGISSAGGMPSGPPVVRSYAPPRVVVPAWAWLPSPKPACRDPIPGHESGPRRGDVTLLPTPCRVRSQNPTHPKQNATRSACPSFRTGLSGPAIRATLSGAVRARAVVYRVKSLSPPPRKSGYRAVQEG